MEALDGLAMDASNIFPGCRVAACRSRYTRLRVASHRGRREGEAPLQAIFGYGKSDGENGMGISGSASNRNDIQRRPQRLPLPV